MKADIRREAVYPHPREKVWAALTSPEALSAWLMPVHDFRLEAGADFTFRMPPKPGFDGITRCRVLELEPPERMVWAWVGGPIDTTVTFTLDDLGDGRTRLRLHQAGFAGLPAYLVRLLLDRGWHKILRDRLAADLSERNPVGLSTIDVISIPVADQDRARDFYVDAFGFEVLNDVSMGPGRRWLSLRPAGGGASITLVTSFDSMPAGSTRGLVIRCDDVDKTFAALREKDVRIDGAVQDAPWGRYFEAYDPDGNGWVVQQQGAPTTG